MHDWREEIVYLLLIVVLLLATFIVSLFIERRKKKEKDSMPIKMTEYVPLPSTMRPQLTQHQAELAAYAMQRALNECKERTSDDPFFQKVNESMCREIEAAMDKLCRIAGIYLETHRGGENCPGETTDTACPGEQGGGMSHEI